MQEPQNLYQTQSSRNARVELCLCGADTHARLIFLLFLFLAA
jgi:hypothetical protein